MDVTVREAKAQLSRLLRLVEAGEEITIHRGRQPVATLVRAPKATGSRQIWGDLEGRVEPGFDAQLPDFRPYHR